VFFSHLECSRPCGAGPLDPRSRQHLCACGAPLLARYDLDRARHWPRAGLQGREPNMWRYREMMPLFDGEQPVTLGEGLTPLIHARRLGATLGLERLYIKDESLNPTNSFKARNISAPGRSRCRRPATPATRPPPIRRPRGSPAKCSFRATPSARSSTSAGCTAPTSRSSTG
jgi:threonine synthase